MTKPESQIARATALGLTVCLTPLALVAGRATALERRFQAHSDYMAATRSNEAGDTVGVVVLRGDKEITLQVTLSPAS